MDATFLDGVAAQLGTLGYELVDARWLRSGRMVTLQVFIDKEGGVNIDDCVAASRQLSVWLDVENPMAGPYRLEVSSPGLDRPLRKREDFQRFVGEPAELELHAVQEGRRRWKGVIAAAEEDGVHLQTELGRRVFPWEAIHRAKLDPRWS